MNNIIFNAFASFGNKQLEPKCRDYYECIVVSLCSAKLQAPNDEVAIVTNCEVPEPYKSVLIKNEINIIQCPFDTFVFEADMAWSLAFYKLCALKYMVENYDYERYLLVDTDTFFQRPIEDIWEDSNNNILLYVTGHSIRHDQVVGMRGCYQDIYKQDISLIHYGGEFICGNRKLLDVFVKQLARIYQDMIDCGVRTSQGDEFITSVAATEDRTAIKPANAYICRYWTGKPNIVSTNYKYDPVAILHLPSEKGCQFKYLFRYFLKHNSFPKNTHWITSMPSTRRRFQYFLFKLYSKIVK